MPDFSILFETGDFPARWTCGNWTHAHGWLHIVSDLAIFGAYLAIPFVLAVFLLRRRDIPFLRVFWLFAAFIAFCGTTHLIEAIIFWKPVYRLAGVAKLGTAIVSWATVIALVPTLKQALQLRSPAALEAEVALRTTELANEKAQLETILDSVGVGVAVASADGELTMFNRAAENILGLGAAPIPSNEWSSHYGIFKSDGETPYEESELPLVRALGFEEVNDETIVIRNHGQPERTILVAARPIVSSSGLLGAVASFSDITARVQVERDLERSNKDLEQFAFAASHDLTEPLRQMAGFSELLLEQDIDEQSQQYLTFIHDGAKRMQELVKGLLSYSRVDSADITPEEVSLEKAVAEVLLDLERLLTESGATVEQVNLSQTVLANPIQLRQLLQNLISNAIKFSRQAPSVTITATEKGPNLVCSVKDNGIGIAAQHHERIFKIFQRLHSRDDYSGTGIGLALCHRIVTGWGGEIWLESTPGEGTTFFFTIQIAR